MFVLDASGSLDEPNFVHVKNFVSNLVSDLDVDSGKIRVGLATYSDYAEPRFHLVLYNTRYYLSIGLKSPKMFYTKGAWQSQPSLKYSLAICIPYS